MEVVLAGHSKWANIKRRKGAQDVIRGKLFTKLIKEISVAAKLGGGDPDANPRLRQAVDKARGNSMPKATVERAIAKATGEGGADTYENITYEGYGPGGVAVLVECLTDNRHRTASEVRHAFNKYGGNLGTSGSVSYMFQRKGIITVSKQDVDEDTLIMAALEGGGDDVEDDGEEWSVTCEREVYDSVKVALEEAGATVLRSEVTQVPDNMVQMGAGEVGSLLKLLERLEDLDDVQESYTNADFDEDLLDSM
jgi:YebC/PmpR family DNA-binding regulatory protein